MIQRLYILLIASFSFSTLVGAGAKYIYIDGKSKAKEKGTETAPYRTIEKALFATKKHTNITFIVAEGDYIMNKGISLDKSSTSFSKLLTTLVL